MYHTIYKITNILNDKIYIGKHSTENLDDSYMGSGSYIRRSIKKYGVENFKKEILFIFDSSEEAYKKEIEIVNEDFVLRTDTYNIITGGDSFEAINSNEELRKEKNKRAAVSMNRINWTNPEFIKRNHDRMSEQNKRLFNEGILKAPDWTGRKHKDETKIKQSISAKKRIREKNKHCWVYHYVDGNKKIKISEIDTYLINGWIKGRIMK